MDKKRIGNAINIINHAIDNNISVQKASIEYGFGNTYVKNIKALIIKDYNDGLLDKTEYDSFFNEYNKYIYNNNKPKLKNNIQNNNKIQNNISTIANNKLSQKESNNIMDIDYSCNSSYPKGHIKTLKQLLEKCEVDLENWSVKEQKVNKWDVTSWKNGNPQTIENFQVKATLQKRVENINRKDIEKLFKENINKYSPPSFINNVETINKSNNLLEICLFDTHFNKYVWHEETDDRYDVEIAEKRFLNAITTFVDRAKGFGFNKILFPIGNDFFNSDGMGNLTTAGTPQDNQLLWHQAFRRGVKLIKDAIYLLKQNGVSVDVLIIPGNHDYANSFYLGEYLSAWFKDDELVFIDNSPNPRKYYSYGEVLLGFTHGSEEKRDSLPMLMANEKNLWAKSKYREWHLGHFHRKKNFKHTILHKGLEVDEEDGMTIRYLSSLAGTDSWHNKKGYITNQKAGDGFIWGAKEGLMAHININV